jgi:hypothetical protein
VRRLALALAVLAAFALAGVACDRYVVLTLDAHDDAGYDGSYVPDAALAGDGGGFDAFHDAL